MANTVNGWLNKAALTALVLGVVGVSPAAFAQQNQVLLSDGTSVPADQAPADPSQDPPSVVARISALDGNVSYEPASVNDFSAAELNYPLTTGDRLYADASSDAEFQTGNIAVRLGAYTDLTLTGLTDTLTQLGLAQGRLHLRTFQLDPSSTVELDTPNVAITVLAAGDVRVETDPNSDTTLVTVFDGQVQVDGNGLQIALQAGQSVQLRGSQPVSAQWMQIEPQDALDAFSAQRDSQYVNGFAAQGNDLNPETIGGEDLAQYGQWQNDADNGPVWYPSGVAVDWEPYRAGHWVWIAPWGWTWVEAEPWGFAPFHYGRWGRFGNRWGWVPGPPVVRPIWSPALVVFVGAPGVTAWFPLGPREPFVPWYHASTLYVNRVNVSNIYNRNTSQVRSAYNQRTTSLYPNEPGNHNYANRQIATVAMPQDAFAAGRPVAKNILRGQQLGAAPIVPHPLVTPQRTMVASTPARAIPPHTARPTLTSRQDTRVTAPPPSRQPNPQGVQPAPQPAPITRNPPRSQPPMQGNPGRAPLPSPQPTPTNDGPPMRATPGRAPISTPQPAPTNDEPPMRATPGRAPIQAPQPTRPPQQLQEPEQLTTHTQQPQPTDRPLFNKAVPPEPRPSFEQQRQAIEQTDPGRPLSPQQMQNVRQNQPAGPAQTHEAPHPAPAPKPAPAPPSNDKRR